MLITPLVAIVLRFWSRALAPSSKGPRFWWDDWLALAALVKVPSMLLNDKVYQDAGLNSHEMAFVEVLSIYNVLCDSSLIYTI